MLSVNFKIYAMFFSFYVIEKFVEPVKFLQDWWAIDSLSYWSYGASTILSSKR